MDLLIVGDANDDFALSVDQMTQSQGYKADILDPESAAQLFTIAIQSKQATVIPDIPLILRLLAPPTLRTSFDESFQYGESLATLWAAATLTKSPVINRPTANSFWGHASYSSTITYQRAQLEPEFTEVFALYPPPPRGNLVEQQWYIQNTATQEVQPWSSILHEPGPYRGKWSNYEPAYELVTVLGDQAWRSTSTPLEHLELESKSVFIVRNLELSFATLWWNVSEDLQQASLVRVNPFPTMSELQFVWSDLGSALMEVLFPCCM
jgi:hypothetical protein